MVERLKKFIRFVVTTLRLSSKKALIVRVTNSTERLNITC